MEKYLYSASNDNFYISTEKARYIANNAWPVDGVEVSMVAFTEFTQNAPDGKKRGADTKGHPTWADIPSLTHDEIVTLQELKKERLKNYANTYINEQHWSSKLMLGRLPDDEKLLFNKWLDYLDALKEINVSDAPNISWPIRPVEQAN